MMKITDGHVHIGRWSSVFLDYESDVKEAAEVMKSAGVDSAVALPCDTFENEKLLKEILNQNEFRFHFACWINPDDTNLDSFIENYGVHIKALKIHPSFQRRNVLDMSYQKYFDYAESRNIPAIIHCGRWKEIAGYNFPLELAEKRKSLNIILAHLGGDQPSICTSCAQDIRAKSLKNVYLGTESVREFYFVNQVVNIAGADKVIFGSDYNLGLPQMYIPIVEKLKISNEEKQMIFSGNISRLLNIE
jgi:hypothetical protein